MKNACKRDSFLNFQYTFWNPLAHSSLFHPFEKNKFVAMFASLALVLIAICAFVLYLNTSSLLKNIAIAKRTGLPYVITRQ